jgi:hypothetical protein
MKYDRPPSSAGGDNNDQISGLEGIVLRLTAGGPVIV